MTEAEKPLGYCTVCHRVRYLATTTDEKEMQGVCTQCEREGAEQNEGLLEFVRLDSDFDRGLGEIDGTDDAA